MAAAGYAEQVRDSLTEKPYPRGMVTLFADLVRSAGDGPVADAGCRPPGRRGDARLPRGQRHHPQDDGYGGNPMDVYIHRRPPARMAAWLSQAGFTVEAQTTLDPAGRLPGAVLFAR